MGVVTCSLGNMDVRREGVAAPGGEESDGGDGGRGEDSAVMQYATSAEAALFARLLDQLDRLCPGCKGSWQLLAATLRTLGVLIHDRQLRLLACESKWVNVFARVLHVAVQAPTEMEIREEPLMLDARREALRWLIHVVGALYGSSLDPSISARVTEAGVLSVLRDAARLHHDNVHVYRELSSLACVLAITSLERQCALWAAEHYDLPMWLFNMVNAGARRASFSTVVVVVVVVREAHFVSHLADDKGTRLFASLATAACAMHWQLRSQLISNDTITAALSFSSNTDLDSVDRVFADASAPSLLGRIGALLSTSDESIQCIAIMFVYVQLAVLPPGLRAEAVDSAGLGKSIARLTLSFHRRVRLLAGRCVQLAGLGMRLYELLEAGDDDFQEWSVEQVESHFVRDVVFVMVYDGVMKCVCACACLSVSLFVLPRPVASSAQFGCGLESCASVFSANQVDGAALSLLDDSVLTDMGITSVVERERILRTIGQLYECRYSSVDGVGAWLRHLGLPQYIPHFSRARVSVELLPLLTDEDLRDGCFVRNAAHRRCVCDGVCDGVMV
jgi:hypothetical protein